MYWLIYLYGLAVACVVFTDKKDMSDAYALFSTTLLAALWPVTLLGSLLRKIIR